MMEPRAAIFF